MPNGTSISVDESARLGEIGFPEFTAKLVTDVFDALVAANITQTAAYVELVQEMGKSLKDFINDTKDDIGGDQILQFLAATLPPTTATEEPSVVEVGHTLTASEVTTLNNALEVAELDAPYNKVATAVALNAPGVDAILNAVAVRIAANKYTTLKEMVRQGILRLVVESGVIETRLTFSTFGSSFYENNAQSFHRDDFAFRAKASTGKSLSAWVKASAATSYTSVNVRTAQETHRDVSGSNVQIFGRVEIRFKTDYQPLGQ